MKEGSRSQRRMNKKRPRRIKLPGAYQPTAEEVEASLAKIFTPEEMVEMDKVDLDNLPVGAKSLSEMINEDREDRF